MFIDIRRLEHLTTLSYILIHRHVTFPRCSEDSQRAFIVFVNLMFIILFRASSAPGNLTLQNNFNFERHQSWNTSPTLSPRARKWLSGLKLTVWLLQPLLIHLKVIIYSSNIFHPKKQRTVQKQCTQNWFMQLCALHVISYLWWFVFRSCS